MVGVARWGYLVIVRAMWVLGRSTGVASWMGFVVCACSARRLLEESVGWSCQLRRIALHLHAGGVSVDYSHFDGFGGTVLLCMEVLGLEVTSHG